MRVECRVVQRLHRLIGEENGEQCTDDGEDLEANTYIIGDK